AIIDNYATHRHPKVRKWLTQHPRWTFHFTPTSASWLNAVEGFFAKLTNRRLKRGVFRSVAELETAIERFIAETNADPKPFLWTAPPNRILAAVKRGKQTLEGTPNNTRFRRFLPWLSGRLQRSCRGESPIGDRFDAWPASARSFARCHTDSTRERTQAGAAAIRSS